MSEGLFENKNPPNDNVDHSDDEKGVTPSAVSAEDRRTLKARRKEKLNKEQVMFIQSNPCSK